MIRTQNGVQYENVDGNISVNFAQIKCPHCEYVYAVVHNWNGWTTQITPYCPSCGKDVRQSPQGQALLSERDSGEKVKPPICPACGERTMLHGFRFYCSGCNQFCQKELSNLNLKGGVKEPGKAL